MWLCALEGEWLLTLHTSHLVRDGDVLVDCIPVRAFGVRLEHCLELIEILRGAPEAGTGGGDGVREGNGRDGWRAWSKVARDYRVLRVGGDCARAGWGEFQVGRWRDRGRGHGGAQPHSPAPHFRRYRPPPASP